MNSEEKKQYEKLICELRIPGGEAVKKRLIDKGEPVEIPRGELIQCEGCGGRLAVLLKGSARAENGGGAILNSFEPGTVFGAAAVFSGREPISAVRAATGCTVVFLSGGELLDCLRGDPDAAESYIRFLCGRIAFLNRKIESFTGGEAEQRLLEYLKRQWGGSVTPKGGMTALAAALGISRPSLYRAMASLERSGSIIHEGKNVRLSPPDSRREPLREEAPETYR